MKFDRKTAFPGTAPSGQSGFPRRRLIAVTAALPLLAAASLLATPRRVLAAATVAAAAAPAQLGALDRAAMALFDAAEAGNWAHATAALAHAQTAADAVAVLESTYVAAGGELRRFFQARNDLVGDLIEAKTALSVKDRRWLVSSAGRIASRAGELSEPFTTHSNALVPRVTSLLFLARRMRQALVWQDNAGLRTAQDDFRRLWSSLRAELTDVPPDKVHALDDSLKRAIAAGSRANVMAVYRDVLALRQSLDPGG